MNTDCFYSDKTCFYFTLDDSCFVLFPRQWLFSTHPQIITVFFYPRNQLRFISPHKMIIPHFSPENRCFLIYPPTMAFYIFISIQKTPTGSANFWVVSGIYLIVSSIWALEAFWVSFGRDFGEFVKSEKS